MDHLPQLTEPRGNYPWIPWICVQKYDAKDFEDYPGNLAGAGRPKELLRYGPVDAPAYSQPNTGSFLQGWLYYGMLKECLSISLDEFKRDYLENGELGVRVKATLLNERISESFGAFVGESGSSVQINLPTKEVILTIGVLGATFDHAIGWYANQPPVERRWGLVDTAMMRMLSYDVRGMSVSLGIAYQKRVCLQ
ncbi:hypothetical protein H072_11418 [Dactylellina haptotyla CBS 200.50]|uniref:Uncharacterized protein n=1 Tax=Dactylellina haptotyla (strain CBS 200.50) TaxID=1284197 RepID=S7ZWR0_DACHA|nr:hypothetical protein H072_11418 [Dactylellina haptotyla CBS 200.50]